MTPRPGVAGSDLANATRLAVATLGTFAVLAPIAHVTRQPDEFVVLGVVICLTSARSALRRRPTSIRPILLHTIAFPVLAASVALLETLFADDRIAADALFVVVAFGALWTRRFPPVVAEVARLLQLPLIALLVAPVPSADRGLHGAGWLLLASGVATTLGTLVQLSGRSRATPMASSRRSPPRRQERRQRIPATTRLAFQTAVGLVLAFLIGQLCFSPRWTWTVVSAFTVGAGARSRGDVMVKGVERLAGALAGTVIATVVAGVVGDNRDGAVVAAFGFILVGLAVRERAYAAWAFCVTGALALLYDLLGESARALLGERLEEVAIGAACAIFAAVVVHPIPTEAVTRRAMADALAAADALLVASSASAERSRAHDPAHETDRDRAGGGVGEGVPGRGDLDLAALDDHLARLQEVSRPLRVARRMRLPGGHVAAWVELAVQWIGHARALVEPVRAHAGPGAWDAGPGAWDAETAAHLRRSLGVLRRHLRAPLPPLAESDVPVIDERAASAR